MYKTQFFRKMIFLVYLKENKINWYETILLKKYSFAIKIEKKDVIKKQILKYIKSCRDHVICHFLFQNGGSVKWVGVWDEVIAMLLCFVMWFSYWHSKMHFSIPDTQELHDGAGATYTVNDTIWFFCCVIKWASLQSSCWFLLMMITNSSSSLWKYIPSLCRFLWQCVLYREIMWIRISIYYDNLVSN